MKKLSVREARQALSHMDQILDGEGEVTITRRGKAIARVSAISKRRPIPSHRSLRSKMPLLKKGSEKLIREERDAR